MALQLNTRVENVREDKCWIVSGFICPPVVFVIEGLYASISLIFKHTHQKKQIKAFLTNSLIERAKFRLYCYLLTKLQKNEKILRLYDAQAHQQNLAQLVNKAFMCRSLHDTSYASAIFGEMPELKNYHELLDRDFYFQMQECLNERNLWSLEIDKLIEEYNKYSSPIAEYGMNIEKMSKKLSEKSSKFYEVLTPLNVASQEAKNTLNRIEELERRQKNASKQESITEAKAELSTSMSNLMSDVQQRSAKLTKIRSSTNEIFKVSEDEESRKALKQELKEMESHDLEEKFKNNIKPLELENARLQIEIRILKALQVSIISVIRFKLSTKEKEARGVHALCCLTFFGAYPRGIYEWIQLNKPAISLPTVAE